MNENGGDHWRQTLQPFIDLYQDDLPEPNALPAELQLWERYWLDCSSVRPGNISKTLKQIKFNGFSNIKVLLRILGTLPVTTCEVERVFSAMKTLKTFSRSTMTNNRLNGLALIYIHRDFLPSFNLIIDRFSIKSRRLDFTRKHPYLKSISYLEESDSDSED